MLEMHYRNMLFLLLKFFNFKVQAELETAEGIIDLCVETEKYVYVMECKRNLSAAKALEQIDLKNYALPFKAGKRKIFKIGAAFSSKERTLSEWAMAEEQ